MLFLRYFFRIFSLLVVFSAGVILQPLESRAERSCTDASHLRSHPLKKNFPPIPQTATFAHSIEQSYAYFGFGFDWVARRLLFDIYGLDLVDGVDEGYLVRFTVDDLPPVYASGCPGTSDFVYTTKRLSEATVNEMKLRYPDGAFPVSISVFRTSSPLKIGSFCHVSPDSPDLEPFDELLFTTSPKYENRIKTTPYKVGIVQLTVGPIDFKNLNLCVSSAKGGLYGDGGNVVEYIPTTIASTCTGLRETSRVLSLPLEKIFWGEADGPVIPDVRNTITQRVADLPLYSLKAAERYWNQAPRKQGVRDTILGRDPKFEWDFLTPRQAVSLPPSFDYEDYEGVDDFFFQEVKLQNIDLSPYDFVTFILFVPRELYWNYYFRAHAFAPYSFTPILLDANYLAQGIDLRVLIHEAGHQLFKLDDLYYNDGRSFGAQVPVGLPDPEKLDQTSACIMAGVYEFDIPRDLLDNTTAAGQNYTRLNPHPFNDLENYHLCMSDLQKMSVNDFACSEYDFYSLQCGECTSRNYTSCAPCITGSEPLCSRANQIFSISGSIRSSGKRQLPTKVLKRAQVQAVNKRSRRKYSGPVVAGAYSIDLPPGEYVLRVIRAGNYSSTPRKVSVVDLHEVDRDLSLTKKR